MKRYLMILVLTVCAAFCLSGCRKTGEETGTQDIREEAPASGEETAEEEDRGKMQYQETIEMSLDEDQGGAVTPAE